MTALLAQGSEALGPTLGPWANLAAVTVMIGLLVWMVTTFMPKLMAQQREEREKIASTERAEREGLRISFLNAIQERDSKISDLIQEHNAAVVESTAVSRECAHVLRDATSLINKLKQSAPSISVHSPATIEVSDSGSGVITKGREPGAK